MFGCLQRKLSIINFSVGCFRRKQRLTFHDRVGLQDLLFNPRVLTTDGRQVLQDQLCALSLPGARLAAAAKKNHLSQRV